MRVLSVLALLLFAGNTLLPVIHKLAVQHSVCAAHGGWIHVEEAAGQAHQSSRGSGYLPAQGDHQHGHCEACVSSRQDPSYRLNALSTVLPVPLAPLVQRSLVGVESPSENERYRVAPKQGPPAFS